MALAELFRIFFRIGLFSIGGGYVMLPMLRREVVEQRGWITDEDLLDYYAIGQATPGIIAVNTSTFVGFRRGGIAGALSATAGMVTPSLIIISIIALFFSHFQDVVLVQRAFRGIRVAVAMLLIFTVSGMFRKSVKDLMGIVLVVGAFCCIVLGGTSPVPVIFAAGLTGLAAGSRRRARA